MTWIWGWQMTLVDLASVWLRLWMAWCYIYHRYRNIPQSPPSAACHPVRIHKRRSGHVCRHSALFLLNMNPLPRVVSHTLSSRYAAHYNLQYIIHSVYELFDSRLNHLNEYELCWLPCRRGLQCTLSSKMTNRFFIIWVISWKIPQK